MWPWIIYQHHIPNPCNCTFACNFSFIHLTVRQKQHEAGTHRSWRLFKRNNSEQERHFAVFLELCGKTKRSSSFLRTQIQRAQRREASKHNKHRISSYWTQRTSFGGPVHDDTPVEVAGGADTVLPLLPHVCPARNTVLLHRSPSPCFQYCRTPITHQHKRASSQMTLKDVSGVEFQNKITAENTEPPHY